LIDRGRRLIGSLAVLVSADVLAAQQPPTPRFETGVDILQLDVSVLDQKRVSPGAEAIRVG
jgi:hypothetical protein